MRSADVELTDGERIDHGDRVAGHRSVDGPRRRLGYDEQFAEAPLRVWVLPDDAQPPCPAVDQPDRHRGHACSDGKRVAASRTVADDLADELVAHHNVS